MRPSGRVSRRHGRGPALRLAIGAALAGGMVVATPRPLAGTPAARLAVVRIQLVDRTIDGNVVKMRADLTIDGRPPERVLADAFERTGRYTVVAVDSTDTDAPAGVDRVVVASITKVSDIIWEISVSLRDAHDDARRLNEWIEAKGEIHDLLPKALFAIARRLAARDTSTAAVTPAGSARLTRTDVERALAAASPEAPASLAGADLSGVDLSGLDFKRATLAHARLVGTRFVGANLFGVTLEGADARGADLTRAVVDVGVMRDADLTGAVLREASLYAVIATGTIFTDADLSAARIIAAMSGSKLQRAKLVGTRFGADPANQPMGIMRTDLTGADLSDADLTGADLRKAVLVRATLSRADLTNADVSGADFAGAVLTDVKGRGRIRGIDRARNLDHGALGVP